MNEVSRHAIIIEADDKIISLNQTAQQLLEVSNSADVIGKSLLKFIHPDCNDSFRRKIDWIKTHGLPSGYTTQKLITISGKVIEVDIALDDRPGQRGGEIQFTARMSTLRRINGSEDKSAIASDNRSVSDKLVLNVDDLLKAFIDNVPDMIYFLGLDGSRADLNEAVYAMTRYSPREFEQDSSLWTRIIHPDDLQVRQEKLAKNPASVKYHECEYRLKNRKGEWLWIHSRCMPARDSSGQLIGFYCLDHDISSQKQALESLEESERKFRELAEKSLVGIYLIQDACFKYVNPKFGELFGYTQDELIDKMGPRDVVHPEDYPEVEKNIDRRISGAAESIRYCFRGQTKSGKYIDIEVYGSRIFHNGQPAVIGTLLELTDQKRKQTLQQLIFQISQKANEEIGVESFLKFIRAKLNQLFDIKNFYLALFDRATQTYSFPYFEDTFDRFSAFSQSELKHSLTDYVRRTGQPLFADNQKQIEMRNRNEIDLVGTISHIWMGVPLKIQGDVFGVIAVQVYSEQIEYTQEDFEILQYIAEHIAAAIYRKQAEDNQTRTDKLLIAALEQSSAGIIIANADNVTIRLANQAALLIRGETDLPLTNISLEDLTSHWQVYFPDGSICFPEEFPLTKSIKTGEIVNDMEIIIKRDDGEKRWISITSAPIKDSDGVIIAGIAVFPDITERKRMEEELKATNAQLLADQKSLRDKNIALRELLSQIDKEKEAIENQIQANLDNVVSPVLRSLREGSDVVLMEKLEMLAKSLSDISSPFVNKLQNQFSKLTPRELEICNLIKQGHVSKDISKLLNVSIETVHQQRKSIRRKLGLTNKNVNLQTYLSSTT